MFGLKVSRLQFPRSKHEDSRTVLGGQSLGSWRRFFFFFSSNRFLSSRALVEEPWLSLTFPRIGLVPPLENLAGTLGQAHLECVPGGSQLPPSPHRCSVAPVAPHFKGNETDLLWVAWVSAGFLRSTGWPGVHGNSVCGQPAPKDTLQSRC